LYVDVDVGTVGTYFNVIDDTQGCNHHNYHLEISGGTPASSWSDSTYGLWAVGGTYLAGEGTYWAEDHVTLQCDCGVGLIDGGGTYLSWFIGAYPFRHHYERIAVGNPSTYALMNDSFGRMCAHMTLTWPSSPSPEPAWLTDSGLYFTLFGDPIGCNSICAGGKNDTVLGPSGPLLDPASCG
jgi:hypothetical protein